MKKRDPSSFTSRMSRGETLAAVIYLPVHVLGLPFLLGLLVLRGWMNEADMNLICYAVGALYMLVVERKFLRREFDPLCDRPLDCLLQICVCYGLMLAMNICVNGLLLLLLPAENPNTSAIVGMAGQEYGKISAMAIFLAPIVEELIFRAGVFGLLRRRSRLLGYAASMLLFAVYHIWGYALSDPMSWLYIVQYLPVSYLLVRCYERTDSIWCSIFLHMIINGVSLRALTLLQELM